MFQKNIIYYSLYKTTHACSVNNMLKRIRLKMSREPENHQRGGLGFRGLQPPFEFSEIKSNKTKLPGCN